MAAQEKAHAAGGPGVGSRSDSRANSTADPVQEILSRLGSARQTGPSRWMAPCPGPLHERGDRHPSLSIGATSDGAALIHCFAGCEAADILAAVGLTLADLFPARDGRDPTYRGGRPKVPPIPWRDVIEALKLDLCACSLAFSDLAAGKTFSPEDAAQFAKFADDLAGKLREVGHGR